MSPSKDRERHDKIKDKDLSNDNADIEERAPVTASITADNLYERNNYYMKIEPPKINYSTIIIKPPSKGGLEERKKESLLEKAKEVEESVKRNLHID